MAISRSQQVCLAVLAIATASLALVKEKKKAKKRRCWTREWLKRRERLGCYENLMRELALEDKEGYRRWMRMDTGAFEFLLHRISPNVAKQNTVMRQAIPPAERLAITLRYLATGETQSSLAFQFRIAQNTTSKIIAEVCRALYDSLKEEFLSVPTTPCQWKEIAKGFEMMWNFPMCIGAMDGKHIKIVPPPGSGSAYYNYKGDFSIVLLALVDSNLHFIYADVGTNGRISDGGVWDKSKLKKALESNSLNVPEASLLPGTDVTVPYVIVADDAFPLSPTIMKPYCGKSLDADKRIFNYRLSRARRVAENAFGILAARFQVYKSCLLTSPANAKILVLVTCCLHNFLRSRSSGVYIPSESMDVEDVDKKHVRPGNWRDSVSALQKFSSRGGNRTCQSAKEIQKRFNMYFNSVGSVSWQEEMCYLH